MDRGLPVTRVISRVVLQQLLAETAQKMAGEDIILNDQNVIDYEHVVSCTFGPWQSCMRHECLLRCWRHLWLLVPGRMLCYLT